MLRLWGLGTLGLVLAIAAGAYLWEKQLPERIQSALHTKDYKACITTSEQLAALRWLGDGAPEEQALCRQKHAQQLWDKGDPVAALALQQQLVASGHGNLDVHRATSLRPGGHMPHRKAANGDCAHYCLPGPLDEYEENVRQLWNNYGTRSWGSRDRRVSCGSWYETP